MTLDEKINRLLLAAVWINGHARLGNIVITLFQGHSYLPAKNHAAAVEHFDAKGGLVEAVVVRAESKDLVQRAAMTAVIEMEERYLGRELEFQGTLGCLDDLKNLDMRDHRPGDCLWVGPAPEPVMYTFDPDSMLPVDETSSEWPSVVKANTGHEAGRWVLLPLSEGTDAK